MKKELTVKHGYGMTLAAALAAAFAARSFVNVDAMGFLKFE